MGREINKKIEISPLSIRLTRKMLDNFKFATNKTNDKLSQWTNHKVLTYNYGYNLGLIWCWDNKEKNGILYRFEVYPMKSEEAYNASYMKSGDEE